MAFLRSLPDDAAHWWLVQRAAHAIGLVADDDHLEEVVALIGERSGRNCHGLFEALGRMRRPEAVTAALGFLDDEETRPWAIRALGELRSERARPALEAIAAQPRPRGRSEGDDRTRVQIDSPSGRWRSSTVRPL
jgi:HEAT repeat protein